MRTLPAATVIISPKLSREKISMNTINNYLPLVDISLEKKRVGWERTEKNSILILPKNGNTIFFVVDSVSRFYLFWWKNEMSEDEGKKQTLFTELFSTFFIVILFYFFPLLIFHLWRNSLRNFFPICLKFLFRKLLFQFFFCYLTLKILSV